MAPPTTADERCTSTTSARPQGVPVVEWEGTSPGRPTVRPGANDSRPGWPGPAEVPSGGSPGALAGSPCCRRVRGVERGPGIVLNAGAPATLQNRGDQACVRMSPRAGCVRLDLTGAVVTEGGLTLRRPADGHRADYTEVTARNALDRFGVITADRHGKSTNVLTFTNAGMTATLTELRGRDMPRAPAELCDRYMPLTVTAAGADSLAQDLGTSPLREAYRPHPLRARHPAPRHPRHHRRGSGSRSARQEPASLPPSVPAVRDAVRPAVRQRRRACRGREGREEAHPGRRSIRVRPCG